MAARCLFRVLKTTPALLHRLRPIDDALCNSKISPTRGFVTKLPEHKIWESQSAMLRKELLAPITPSPESGLDFEHWFVQVKLPDREMSRDEIIDYYIQVLAEAVGSEEQARMKIYNVSTKHYFAFGVLGDEELASKLRGSCKVLAVNADIYLDVYNKDYGGEPFINGQPVPYDRKYHAAYWDMQEAMYKPRPGAEIPDDMVVPDVFSGYAIDDDMPFDDDDADIPAEQAADIPAEQAEQHTPVPPWLSRVRAWWNGPIP